MASLRPQYKRRQSRLRQALLKYPLYDPPHKAEERVLPVEQALENFRYFMDVRKDRVTYFMQWLRDEFGIDASLEPAGIDATLDWARDYVPVIMPYDNHDRDPAVYYGRAEPGWVTTPVPMHSSISGPCLARPSSCGVRTCDGKWSGRCPTIRASNGQPMPRP